MDFVFLIYRSLKVTQGCNAAIWEWYIWILRIYV